MAIVTPVFNLHGCCEEVIELYKRAFQAEVKMLIRYSEADKRDYDKDLTDKQKNMIYHSEIMIGNQRIMLSDMIDHELSKGTSLFLTITFDTPDEVRKAYEVLKEGCTIIYPMHSTTYSSCLVSFIDKFGFRWGLMTETP